MNETNKYDFRFNPFPYNSFKEGSILFKEDYQQPPVLALGVFKRYVPLRDVAKRERVLVKILNPLVKRKGKPALKKSS